LIGARPLSTFTHRFFQWFILLSVHPAPWQEDHLINAITLEENKDAAQSKASLAKKNRSRLDAGRTP
jgi:hypothetical protein